MGIKFDDGRFTLLLGSLLVLGYCISQSLIEGYKWVAIWPLKLVLDVLRDLGIAFIVGGIVSLGIERLSRKDFLDEVSQQITSIKKNVMNASYLRMYPDDYTKAITKLLDGNLYYKLDLNIVIDLFIYPNTYDNIDCCSSDGIIIHEQTTSYRARNITHAQLPIKPRMFLDVAWDPFPPTLIDWRVGDTHLGEEELKSLAESPSPQGALSWYTFPKEVTLGPGEETFILAKVRTVKRRRDTTTWCGIQPADSLRFTINHPPDFEAYGQPKTASRSSENPIASDGRRVVVNIFTPLLPYMIVEYGWRPRGEATDNHKDGDETSLRDGALPPT